MPNCEPSQRQPPLCGCRPKPSCRFSNNWTMVLHRGGVQLWASFVLHGFAEGVGSGPITSIDIEFDEATEQTMVDALVRLDEVGDLIDGEVTHDEIVRLIDSLT